MTDDINTPPTDTQGDEPTATLLRVPSEQAMQHYLDALNVSGLSPELACVSRDGVTFLAGLTDPDADHVHYTLTEGDTGRVHCCECEHPGERPTEWDPNLREPGYPVTALVTLDQWPDPARVAENSAANGGWIEPWWETARPVPAETHTDPAAQALRDAIEALADLPGTDATGYYASEQHSGYQEAVRHVETLLTLRADRLAAQAPAHVLGQHT